MNPETAVVVDRFWSKVDKSGPCWLWTGALSEHGPPENRVTFRVSATKLKRFLQCPRSYFLRYVQGVEEDVKGSYLIVGNAFDQAVQHYLSQGARGVASIDPKIVRMLGAARPLLPAPGTVEVQHEYSVEHDSGWGKFTVEGKPDVRLPGRIWDTKTCASREWSLTTETLATDVQARLYAYCEFCKNTALDQVKATWVYVTKTAKPEAWAVTVRFTRQAILDWFWNEAEFTVQAMARLHAEYDADRVVANLDSCERCWTKRHCNPFEGPNQFSTDQVAESLDLAILQGCRNQKGSLVQPPSIVHGSPCANDVTTRPILGSALTVDAASQSVRNGGLTPRSLPMWDPGPDLTTLLSASITMLATARAIADGPPAPSSIETCERLSCPSAESSSGQASLETVSKPASGAFTSGSSKHVSRPHAPETLTSERTACELRSISLDAVSFLGQLQSAIPVLPANVEREMGFNLASLSEPETVVEVSQTPATAIAINPPPVRARKTRTPTETPAQTSLEDLASELQTVVDTCQTAIARVDRLLAALRGKGAA